MIKHLKIRAGIKRLKTRSNKSSNLIYSRTRIKE